jgi:hypothetical protein
LEVVGLSELGFPFCTLVTSAIATTSSDEKVNKQNGDSNVEQDHHDDQNGS